MGTLKVLLLVLPVLFPGAPQDPPNLPGTTWAASYYHCHEDRTFLSADNVAIRTGQWGCSMPVEPQLIDADSLYLGDPELFRYHFDGDQLIVHGRCNGHEQDTLTWDGERFRSNWMFSYGHVMLTPGGNTACRRHN